MAKRKSMGKKTRFEVFKRDAFTCQYCGAKAPEAILVVDHIKPVAGGGDDDITNLITSCHACNSGKGARELDDKSVIEKQRKQLEELNERREQLEMMLAWREGLDKLKDQTLHAVNDRLVEVSGLGMSEHGRKLAARWLKKYPLQNVLEAIDTAYDQRLERDANGVAIIESWGAAFSLVPRILSVEKSAEKKPYLKDLFYVRGILRNRLSYLNDHECLRLLERAYLAGWDADDLKSFAKVVRTWSAFVSEIHEFLEENET